MQAKRKNDDKPKQKPRHPLIYLLTIFLAILWFLFVFITGIQIAVMLNTEIVLWMTFPIYIVAGVYWMQRLLKPQEKSKNQPTKSTKN